MSDPEKRSCKIFLTILNISAKTFGSGSHKLKDEIICAIMRPHLERKPNFGDSQNGIYDQTVNHVEKKELKGLGVPDEQSLTTLNHVETKTNKNI